MADPDDVTTPSARRSLSLGMFCALAFLLALVVTCCIGAYGAVFPAQQHPYPLPTQNPLSAQARLRPPGSAPSGEDS